MIKLIHRANMAEQLATEEKLIKKTHLSIDHHIS